MSIPCSRRSPSSLRPLRRRSRYPLKTGSESANELSKTKLAVFRVCVKLFSVSSRSTAMVFLGIGGRGAGSAGGDYFSDLTINNLCISHSALKTIFGCAAPGPNALSHECGKSVKNRPGRADNLLRRHAMNHPSFTADSRAGIDPRREPGRLRDVLWGQPVFRAPPLANPQFVFDPLPYPTLLAHGRRPGDAEACGPLRAA